MFLDRMQTIKIYFPVSSLAPDSFASHPFFTPHSLVFSNLNLPPSFAGLNIF